MKLPILFVTGSDTGVGKTVFAALLTRHLLNRGFRVAGLKPICSGGRADALALHAAAGNVPTPNSELELANGRRSLRGARVCDPQHVAAPMITGKTLTDPAAAALRVTDPRSASSASAPREILAASEFGLTLDEVNPWHFRAPIAPLLAARREYHRVGLAEVVGYVQRVADSFDVAVVEGAGGLLSPLGEGFDSRDLIRALRAVPVIVCANRLGAVNQGLLVLDALPRLMARRAQIVLMHPPHKDSASRTNPSLLRELAGGAVVHELPHLPNPTALDTALRRAPVRRTLDALLREIGG